MVSHELVADSSREHGQLIGGREGSSLTDDFIRQDGTPRERILARAHGSSGTSRRAEVGAEATRAAARRHSDQLVIEG
jgi:hypothetical protein